MTKSNFLQTIIPISVENGVITNFLLHPSDMSLRNTYLSANPDNIPENFIPQFEAFTIVTSIRIYGNILLGSLNTTFDDVIEFDINDSLLTTNRKFRDTYQPDEIGIIKERVTLSYDDIIGVEYISLETS